MVRHHLNQFDLHMGKRQKKKFGFCEKQLQYFKFAFVRNPWDRMVSAYFYAKEYLGLSMGRFDEFIKEKAWDEYGEAIDPHWEPQHEFIRFNDRFIVDFIGRFENLDADFTEACHQIGIKPCQLPHVNATQHADYKEYYTDELRQIVAEKYAKDIELFGYEFDGG